MYFSYLFYESISGSPSVKSFMTSQHWFELWIGAIRQQNITWANVDPDLWRHIVSLGHDGSNTKNQCPHYCTFHQWIPFTKGQWCWKRSHAMASPEGITDDQIEVHKHIKLIDPWEIWMTYLIFKWILEIDGGGISCEIALIVMSLDFTDHQSTLVQVMAWCRQATSHYLSQCWTRSLSPYGVTRP